MLALPLFHAITGCDTVSHFLGRGNKTAWSAWQSIPDLLHPPTVWMCQVMHQELQVQQGWCALHRSLQMLRGLYQQRLSTRKHESTLCTCVTWVHT